MRGIRRAGVGIMFVAAAAVLSAHLTVSRTFPETNATIAAPPDRIQVWFSQSPTLPVSALSLEGPKGAVALAKVAGGKTDGKPDRSIVAAIGSRLEPGKYTVTWKSAGSDGHIQTGTFVFTLTPGR